MASGQGTKATKARGGLTIAVTGPTGEIGRAFIRAVEEAPQVKRVVGMARSPFDASAYGWTKFEYIEGDILDRDAVATLVEGADVVVHLAFIIFGDEEETRRINIEGSRNVFEAAVEAGAKRLVYTSSVAAYGFHEDNPDVLTEDVPPRGSEDHYYSAQKAELEATLREVTEGSGIETYIFRPCIVAGPTALMLIQKIPYVQLSEKLPDAVRKIVGAVPLLRPLLPDPGLPFQLVHEDDVASALVAAVVGKGTAGVYNLAADGAITVTDLARALGWYSLPLPEIAVGPAVKIVSTLPHMPVLARWAGSLRTPVLMDTSKAKDQLGWQPTYDVVETLAELVQGARARRLIPWPGQTA